MPGSRQYRRTNVHREEWEKERKKRNPNAIGDVPPAPENRYYFLAIPLPMHDDFINLSNLHDNGLDNDNPRVVEVSII